MKNNFFDQQFLEAQNKKLITEKERLEKELNLHGRRGNANQNDFQANYENLGDDEESNAAEYGLAEANIDLVRNLELELRRVTAALERLRAGTYGLDPKSGRPISRRRLEIYPAAASDV